MTDRRDTAGFTLHEGGHWSDFPPEVSDAFLMEQFLKPEHRVDMGKRHGHNPGHPYRIIIIHEGDYYFCASIRLRNGDVFDAFFNAFRTGDVELRPPPARSIRDN